MVTTSLSFMCPNNRPRAVVLSELGGPTDSNVEALGLRAAPQAPSSAAEPTGLGTALGLPFSKTQDLRDVMPD